MISSTSHILREEQRTKRKHGVFLVTISDSKPGKFPGVVENERELSREHDRSFHRHVAICWFVQFLTGHPDLAFNRAEESSRKIEEDADGD